VAAEVAFISSILFLLSGYKANFEIYSLFKDEIKIFLQVIPWLML
jgi:hypothetical protein